ncbi:MAG: hypothetical protein GX625_05585 [Clostridiaceae bacterium]|nr:hypothetical protein [Clostridiaceae bacterium]
MKKFKNITYSFNILLTALVSGFMLFYCNSQGRYLNFILENNLTDGLKIFSQFIQSANPGTLVNSLLITQLLVAVLSLALNFKRRIVPGQVGAIIAPVILMILNFATGFSQCESSIVSGSDLSELNIQFFLKWNIPFHIIYSGSYGIASLWLIFQRGQE